MLWRPSLRDLAHAQGVRGKSGTLPEIVFPHGIERDLAAIYLRVVRAWITEARAVILPAYALAVAREKLRRSYSHADALDKIREYRRATLLDAVGPLSFLDDIKEGEDALRKSTELLTRLIAELTPIVEEWSVRSEQYHRKEFRKGVLNATTVDLNTMLGPWGAREPLEAVIARNMALIRNVSDQTRDRIADIFFRHYQLRTPLRTVAKEISEATGLARDRALRIASDQTVKLAAALDEERQREVGIDEFEWVHSRKVHFRPHHKARDGKIYKWETAASRLKGDLPGVAPFCGCKAKGVFRL